MKAAKDLRQQVRQVFGDEARTELIRRGSVKPDRGGSGEKRLHTLRE